MEAVKDWLYIIGGLLGIGAAWGDAVRRQTNLEKIVEKIGQRMDEQQVRCDNAEYITQPQHDRLQKDCQLLWQNEFIHIKDSLLELKQDIKDLRSIQKQDFKDLRERQNHINRGS